jgi:hypothetical protein
MELILIIILLILLFGGGFGYYRGGYYSRGGGYGIGGILGVVLIVLLRVAAAWRGLRRRLLKAGLQPPAADAGSRARPASARSCDRSASGRAPKWLMISAAHKLPISPQAGSGRPRVKP